LILDIAQILENRSTRDVKYLNSKVNIFDLPSADILAEHFRNLSNSMEYKSIYSFQNMINELAKSNNNVLPTVYENSILTKMMKEHIGGNGLCMGLFTLQNNNFTMSSIVFKLLKSVSHIQCFPVVNDSSCNALLKKFRVEIAYFSKYKDFHPHDIKPPIIPESSNTLKLNPFSNSKLENPFSNTNLSDIRPGTLDNNDANIINDYKRRIAQLESDKLRLERELVNSEEDRLKIAKSLAHSKIPMNNVPRAMDYDNYDYNDKMAHIETDIAETNEIMNTVNQVQEKLKALHEERRILEEENNALRENNSNVARELDRVAMDSNNYRTNSDNELYNLKEVLNSTKNELEFMRNEAEKYRKIQADLLLELDEREVQFKKQLEDREREIEMKMIELSQTEKRRLEQELREAVRKIEHYGDENNDVNSALNELKKKNNKLQLQINELRQTIRDIMAKDVEDKKEEKLDNMGLQINMSSKAKLIKSYTDRENELIEQLGMEKAKTENLKEKLKKMRTFGRKLRNIALDYYPVNEELPELLTKDINIFMEDPENESVIQFLEFEIRTLRERNKKIEFEMNRLREEYKVSPYDEYKQPKTMMSQNIRYNNYDSQNQMAASMMNNPASTNNLYNNTQMPSNYQLNNQPNMSGINLNTNTQINDVDIQRRLLDEIEKLKNARPFSSSKEIEKLKQENSQLIEETKKLRQMVILY
jgi:hypothetical protein